MIFKHHSQKDSPISLLTEPARLLTFISATPDRLPKALIKNKGGVLHEKFAIVSLDCCELFSHVYTLAFVLGRPGFSIKTNFGNLRSDIWYCRCEDEFVMSQVLSGPAIHILRSAPCMEF